MGPFADAARLSSQVSLSSPGNDSMLQPNQFARVATAQRCPPTPSTPGLAQPASRQREHRQSLLGLALRQPFGQLPGLALGDAKGSRRRSTDFDSWQLRCLARAWGPAAPTSRDSWACPLAYGPCAAVRRLGARAGGTGPSAGARPLRESSARPVRFIGQSRRLPRVRGAQRSLDCGALRSIQRAPHAFMAARPLTPLLLKHRQSSGRCRSCSSSGVALPRPGCPP